MTPSRRRWLMAAACAVSLAFHLKGIRAPLLDYHYYRQVNTASIARRFWRDGLPPWQPRIDWSGSEDRLAATELPLEMWLHGKLWPLFGLGETWGRILSAGFSALTALMLFLLCEREFGTEAAFYAAALFGMLPIEIYFGRTIQPEALALFLVVGALYWWDRSLEPGRPFAPWLAATAAVCVAVGLKLPYAFVFAPLLGLAWRRLGKPAFTDARMWAAGLLACAGVVAWYVWASRGLYVVPDHAGEFEGLLDYSRELYYMQFLVFSRFPELVLTYGGAALFFFGAREILYRRRDAFWLSWLGGTFAHLFLCGKYGHSHEYTSLPLAPVAAGLMGVGLKLLREKASAQAPERRRWAFAGLALLVVAVPVHAVLRIRRWYGQGYDYLARAGEAAAAVSRPDDLFVTNCVAESVPLYYLDRRGWSRDLGAWPEDQALQFVAQRRAEGARFIASEKAAAFAEPDGVLWRHFRARSKPVWDDGRLAIFALAPSTAPSAGRP